jgi:DnaK suppressor protein
MWNKLPCFRILNLLGTDPVAPDDAIGRISRMDAINNKGVFDASMGNLKSRLSQLIHILTIVDDKDYGICSRCHQPIPIERLKIRPEVRSCASCLMKKN